MATIEKYKEEELESIEEEAEKLAKDLTNNIFKKGNNFKAFID